jgi:hypothetical protein
MSCEQRDKAKNDDRRMTRKRTVASVVSQTHLTRPFRRLSPYSQHPGLVQGLMQALEQKDVARVVGLIDVEVASIMRND